MDENTLVLPSARAIRHEQLQLEDETLFLPNYITMNEFISKLCIVENYKILDEDTRVLLLLQASDFKEFSSLSIERNFFTFTKNSSYIFKFFEELSSELYEIKNLDMSDIYAEYEEHITILQELYKRYEKLCNDSNFLDKIFLPKLYKFNDEYVSTYKQVNITVEGHLTNFEFELIEKATSYTQVRLHFKTSEFNKKMQLKFAEYGLELQNNYKYIISFNDKSIIDKETIHDNKNIICESFSESVLQIAFIKQQVYSMIQKGYKAENIAVILPDESMATVLKTFDDKANFNFAMGEAYSNSSIYKKLNATVQALEVNSKENYARLNRLGDEIYTELKSVYHKSSSEVDFIDVLSRYKELFSNKQEIKIYEEELHNFKSLLSFIGEMNIKSLLSLFMKRLSKRTIDDVRGGKVTVMGVLETRSISFDGVIIVDFNDTNIPKKSDKDMFLNSSLRENANLPTMSDRESLQKHYYKMLINSSKEVAISYVSSSESKPSRFLKQLGILQTQKFSEDDYANIIFQRVPTKPKEEKRILLEYSFKNIKLSATRLKTFLTCKRKYYHNYIQHIDSHEIPKDMPKEYEIGVSIHTALKELYSNQNRYSDINELKKDLHKELDRVKGESELEKFQVKLQKKRMDVFCENEIKRFNDGWEVYDCEKSLSVNFAGITLTGQIDRVDKRQNEIEVLDYKTGSYPLYNKNNFTEATDFQLEFYYLLAAGLGNVIGCGYYDLKDSKIVSEPFLNEKLAVLESNIKDLLALEEIDFNKCEDLKNCLFCEFKTICGRD